MRAEIAQLANFPGRPRWSVMIPTHNSAPYLRKALESVLAQDPGPQRMQIEVVDDASIDDAAEIVKAVGGGRVSFFRQLSNVGQIENLSAAVARSKGEIVHLLHGDDYVLSGFYDALDKGFAHNPQVGAAFCRWMIVDGQDRTLTVAHREQESAGALPHALERLASDQRIVTPSIAVRRSVWEELGGFDSRLRCAEDWEMWVRIAARYRIWYEPELLAAYRRHDSSTTARNRGNAEELRFTRMAIEMFAPLLPAEQRSQVVRRARRAYARTALANVADYSRQGAWRGVWSNLLMAAKLDPSLRTVRSAARAVIGGVRQK